MDGPSLIRSAATLVVPVSTWLRDEEANYADQPWNKKLGSRFARAGASATLLPLTASS